MNIDDLIKKYNEFFEQEISINDYDADIKYLNICLNSIEKDLLELKIRKRLYQNLLKKAEFNKEKQVEKCLNKISELMEKE